MDGAARPAVIAKGDFATALHRLAVLVSSSKATRVGQQNPPGAPHHAMFVSRANGRREKILDPAQLRWSSAEHED
jgi:hypothetical protein